MMIWNTRTSADHMENLYLSIRKLTSTKFDSRGLAEGVFHHDAV